jgi:hypothetical protein
MFSNLFFITLPNIEKYFPEIHFPKRNYFSANKRGLDFFEISYRRVAEKSCPGFLNPKIHFQTILI